VFGLFATKPGEPDCRGEASVVKASAEPRNGERLMLSGTSASASDGGYHEYCNSPSGARIVRPDWPSCLGQIRPALRPALPIPKSNACPGTLAYVAVAKFADELLCIVVPSIFVILDNWLSSQCPLSVRPAKDAERSLAIYTAAVGFSPLQPSRTKETQNTSQCYLRSTGCTRAFMSFTEPVAIGSRAHLAARHNVAAQSSGQANITP
jgi:hypothetical protein